MKFEVVKEDQYQSQMTDMVEPYLKARFSEMWPQRKDRQEIFCARYLADEPRGVVVISHGFTETAEKYKENIYYFLQENYHVYMPEHCGHGYSYRLTEDLSLVHTDSWQRYVDDFLLVSRLVKEENPELPMYLFAHSMGGAIGAAAAAQDPDLYRKIVLSSPMIRPITGRTPWAISSVWAAAACKLGKGAEYSAGQKPYAGKESFEESCSLSRARFDYYQEKRFQEPRFQMSAPSYGWVYGTVGLNHYLQTTAWKKIQAPVLLFQAEKEHLVSKDEQERFIRKLSRRGLGRLVRVPDAKHEIFNSSDEVVEKFWKKVFHFYER